jgi:hypothetical protein
MDIESLEKDLLRRIDQSREWLSGKPAPITGLKIRNYSCLAVPVKFIDYRKTSGVRFRLEFTTPTGTFEAYVDIDIMPTRSEPKNKEKNPEPPFVDSFVVVDTETKERDLITWEQIVNTVIYKRSVGLPIEEWYKDWLRKTLKHRNVGKIFSYRKEK